MDPVMPWIYMAMATSAVGAIASIVGIYFEAGALNAVVTGNTTAVLGLSFNFWQLLILIAVWVIVSVLCRQGGFVIFHLGAFGLEQILRTRLSDHLAKLPLGFNTNTGSGTLKKSPCGRREHASRLCGGQHPFYREKPGWSSDVPNHDVCD